jgi:hypothetical protein
MARERNFGAVRHRHLDRNHGGIAAVVVVALTDE